MMGGFYFSEIGGAWTETDDFFLLQFYQTLRNGNGGLRQILCKDRWFLDLDG